MTLNKLSREEVKVRVLHSAVGQITESDIQLAKASNAIVVAFNVRATGQAREMAQRDDRYHDAIQRTLVECGPAADGVLEPRWAKEQGIEPLGYGIDETRAFAMKALERRLKVIGLAPVA